MLYNKKKAIKQQRKSDYERKLCIIYTFKKSLVLKRVIQSLMTIVKATLKIARFLGATKRELGKARRR